MYSEFSGQLMLEALLEGKAGPQEIAQLAKRRARQQIPEIAAALEEHQMNAHHRRMIRYSLERMCCIYGFQGGLGFGQNAGRPANRPVQQDHKTYRLFGRP